MTELLADEANTPCGVHAVCNQALQQHYVDCHQYSYEECALECTQRDEPPPEGHIYNIKVGIGELKSQIGSRKAVLVAKPRPPSRPRREVSSAVRLG